MRIGVIECYVVVIGKSREDKQTESLAGESSKDRRVESSPRTSQTESEPLRGKDADRGIVFP